MSHQAMRAFVRSSDHNCRIEIDVPLVCSVGGHGDLQAYATADGKLAVLPCEQCLQDEAEKGAV